MNTCPTCSSPMKPLFTGMYCPHDCDIKAKLHKSVMAQRRAAAATTDPDPDGDWTEAWYTWGSQLLAFTRRVAQQMTGGHIQLFRVDPAPYERYPGYSTITARRRLDGLPWTGKPVT